MTNKTEMVHELRIQTTPFDDLLSGAKTGEVRNSDRGFKVGDSVLLNEVAGEFPVPTGRQMRRRISHIQTGFGLPEGIVVLSYAPPEDVRAVVDEPVAVMYPDGTVLNKTEYRNSFDICCRVHTPLYRHPQRRLEMADVVRAHLDIPHCPVLTSNQCHALAMKLNEVMK